MSVYNHKTMFKPLLAAAAATLLVAPAHAGYYIYSEIESDYEGTEYTDSEITTRIGYETEISESTEVYIELGPSVSLEDGGDADTRLGVEVGADVALTDNLEAYGEVELVTGPTNDYGTKFGLQYNF